MWLPRQPFSQRSGCSLTGVNECELGRVFVYGLKDASERVAVESESFLSVRFGRDEKAGEKQKKQDVKFARWVGIPRRPTLIANWNAKMTAPASATSRLEWRMIRFKSDEEVLRDLRIRLRRMTDAELIKFGKEVKRLSENPFTVQYQEARIEWKRRKRMDRRKR